MISPVLKGCGIWLLFVPLGILNGGLREKVLNPLLGQRVALPLSGVTLGILIVAVTALLIPSLGVLRPSRYWLVGGGWLVMTVFFEFFFGRCVMGHSWAKLLEAYNVLTGNLWVVVLLVIAAAPYLAARLRGLG
ncbi:hypothetical protein [Geobacter pickeringii]|uniref:Uncharacterized protein n=1 Tax=Geobacter pickeringii TaxID=345632 RepID=A0A0B5BCM0_9BACT|nr:hypothetical protein [Geobacter pickeringii]AJE04247.1 hypothetical protein GPICK_13600 [Geobacter pickeringii]